MNRRDIEADIIQHGLTTYWNRARSQRKAGKKLAGKTAGKWKGSEMYQPANLYKTEKMLGEEYIIQ